MNISLGYSSDRAGKRCNFRSHFVLLEETLKCRVASGTAMQVRHSLPTLLTGPEDPVGGGKIKAQADGGIQARAVLLHPSKLARMATREI